MIAEREFGLGSKAVILSFVFSFGISKAVCNYFAGRLADRFGRRKTLILGWLIGVPVPIMVIIAPDWYWIVLANLLLGINQGFAWSMTVTMKIDLAGPTNRGMAVGLNEFAGYLSVSLTLLVSGFIATTYSLRPEPFYLGIGFSVLGLSLSSLKARETKYHSILEAQQSRAHVDRYLAGKEPRPAVRNVFMFTSFSDRALSSSCLAGSVNNLIFGMSWGLFPLFFASNGLGVDTINQIKSVYPAVWGVLQLATGPLSDRVGRKPLIVAGQVVQAAGLWLTASSRGVVSWLVASGLLGLGTALVYPALIAAVGDVAHPKWRASSLGTYRFWRDSGYAIGAVFSGILADLVDIPFAINVVGVLTLGSAVLVLLRMYETLHRVGAVS